MFNLPIYHIRSICRWFGIVRVKAKSLFVLFIVCANFVPQLTHAHGGIRAAVEPALAIKLLRGICVKSYPDFQKADFLRTTFELFDREDDGRVAHHDNDIFVYLTNTNGTNSCSIIFGFTQPIAQIEHSLGQAFDTMGNTTTGHRQDGAALSNSSRSSFLSG